MLVFDDVGARVRGGDDLCGWEKSGIATTVVGMMVRAEHVLDGLIGHAFHLGDDALVVLFELVIDQDDAFARDIHGNVATVAFDLVEIVFDLVQSQLGRLALVLGVSDPATKQEQDAKRSACEKGSAHARTLYQMDSVIRTPATFCTASDTPQHR